MSANYQGANFKPTRRIVLVSEPKQYDLPGKVSWVIKDLLKNLDVNTTYVITVTVDEAVEVPSYYLDEE